MVYTGIHIHTQNWQCLMGHNDKYLWNRRNEGINIHCEHQLFGFSSGCFFAIPPCVCAWESYDGLILCWIWGAWLAKCGIDQEVVGKICSWHFNLRPWPWCLPKNDTHTHPILKLRPLPQTKCQNHAKTQVILHGLLRPQAELRAKICQKNPTTHEG